MLNMPWDSRDETYGSGLPEQNRRKGQFLLFAGPNYYPEGGWRDFQNAFDSLGEASEVGRVIVKSGSDWWYQVVSLADHIIVDRGGS